MNYFEILTETLLSFTWKDYLSFLGMFMFACGAGFSFKFFLLDLKKKLYFVALLMFFLTFACLGLGISVGIELLNYPKEPISITFIVLFASFFLMGTNGIDKEDFPSNG